MLKSKLIYRIKGDRNLVELKVFINFQELEIIDLFHRYKHACAKS